MGGGKVTRVGTPQAASQGRTSKPAATRAAVAVAHSDTGSCWDVLLQDRFWGRGGFVAGGGSCSCNGNKGSPRHLCGCR